MPSPLIQFLFSLSWQDQRENSSEVYHHPQSFLWSPIHIQTVQTLWSRTLGIKKVTTTAHGNMFYTWAHFHPSTAFFPPSPHNLRLHLQVPEWNQFSQLTCFSLLLSPHPSPYFPKAPKDWQPPKAVHCTNTTFAVAFSSEHVKSSKKAVKSRLTTEGSDGRWTQEETERQSSPADGTELNKQASHKWKGGYTYDLQFKKKGIFFACATWFYRKSKLR